MSKVFIDESTLTSIGDAIRAKNNSIAAMSPAEMISAIGAITTGDTGFDTNNLQRIVINNIALQRITYDSDYLYKNNQFPYRYGIRLTDYLTQEQIDRLVCVYTGTAYTSSNASRRLAYAYTINLINSNNSYSAQFNTQFATNTGSQTIENHSMISSNCEIENTNDITNNLLPIGFSNTGTFCFFLKKEDA